MVAPPADIPDAWDDDWETIADKELSSVSPKAPSNPDRRDEAQKSAQATKVDRKALLKDFNRQLWTEAEEGNRELLPFLKTRNTAVPFKSEFKPPVKLLTRNPRNTKPTTAQSPGPVLASRTQHATLALPENLPPASSNENEFTVEEEEEQERKKNEATPEEQMRRAQEGLKEKQRRYEETKKRLFGSSTDTKK